MPPRAFLLVLLYGGLVLGCASQTKQADAVFVSPPVKKRAHEIQGVPFVLQEAGHCGPASLTMTMNWAGLPVRVEEIAPLVFVPGMKGSFQTDMLSAARRQGLLAVQIQGFEALLRELEAGHPVIVFENLAFSWLPQWHYAVVFGYDLDRQEVLMHSGPEKNKRWNMRTFERSWMLGDYWGLVVLPPGQLAVSVDELDQSRATAVLEQLGQLRSAEKSYEAILQRWPSSLASLMGKANVSFTQGRLKEALIALKKAVKEHPSAAMAWHNLALVQHADGSEKEAQQSARRALEFSSPEQKSLFEKNLNPLLGN